MGGERGRVRGKGKERERGERKGRRERSPPPPFQIPGSAPGLVDFIVKWDSATRGCSRSSMCLKYITKKSLLCSVNSSKENALIVTTPSINEAARHLPIKVVLNDRTEIRFNRTFEYRINPVFTDIQPRTHLAV